MCAAPGSKTSQILELMHSRFEESGSQQSLIPSRSVLISHMHTVLYRTTNILWLARSRNGDRERLGVQALPPDDAPGEAPAVATLRRAQPRRHRLPERSPAPRLRLICTCTRSRSHSCLVVAQRVPSAASRGARARRPPVRPHTVRRALQRRRHAAQERRPLGALVPLDGALTPQVRLYERRTLCTRLFTPCRFSDKIFSVITPVGVGDHWAVIR